MRIKTIEAQNFRSFSHFKLELNDLGLTLLNGQNTGIDSERSNGAGKAQPYSEPIMTPMGIKNMGDLKVGDYVYNRFGMPIKVLNIFEKGNLDVYEVTLRDGRKIRVNNEHLFTFFQRKNLKSGIVYKLKTKSLQDIIDGGYKKENKIHPGSYIYKYSIPIPKAIQFPEKQLTYDPYTVGALLGDGYLTGNHTYIIVGDHKLPILEKIVRNNSDTIKGYKENKSPKYRYDFLLKDPYMGKMGKTITLAHNKDLKLPLCVCQNTQAKKIPDDIFQASISQRYQLLQGLFDTDGYIQIRGNRNNTANVSLTSVNLDLVKQVQKLLWSLGYGAIINSTDRRGKHHKSSKYVYKSTEYKIEVIGDLASIQKLFSLPYHLGKLKEAHERRKYTDRMPITNIKKLDYREQMRCIYVDDPEHLYVSGDYFVSHNTSIIYAMIYALYGETPDGAKSDEVIKNDVGKNCFAKVVFTHFGHEYEITRYRKDKEFKNKVIMYRDGKDVTLSTNKETDKEIVATLGFGFDTLLNSVIFSPEKLNTFISATDKHRKEILEELTNTNIYKQALQLVKEDSKESSSKLVEDKKELERLDTLMDSQTALQRQYEQSVAMQKQQADNLENQISLRKAKLDSLNYNPTIHESVKTEYNTYQQQVSAFNFTHSNEYANKLQTAQAQQKNIELQQENIKKQLTDLSAQYKQLQNSEDAVCSWCGNVLDAEHKQLELNNMNKKANELMTSYKALSPRLSALNQDVDNYAKLAREEQEQASKQQEQYRKLTNALNVAQQKLNEQENLVTEINRLNNDINQLKTELEQARTPIEKPKQLDTAGIEKQIKETEADLHKQQSAQEDFEKLTKVYSDRGVKAQALSLVIPYLNDQLEKILKVLTNNTMTVALNNKTTTKSGKINEQISLDVDSSVSGSNYQDLSSGEKRRIGIALNLAFMNYLKSQIGGLNLVVFDEVFDSLDKAGIDSVINVLSDLKQSVGNIIIVSHNDDMKFNDNIDNQLLVKKVDNTSKLVNN